MIDVIMFDDQEKVILETKLPYIPRIGEYLSIETDAIFLHYNVMEVWTRVPEGQLAQVCMLVEVDD